MRYNLDMNVYVEYVILDNFTLDYLIMLAATLTLKAKPCHSRLILAAAFGAACAVASVFVHGAYLYLLKAATLFVMCLVAFGLGKKLFWFTLLTVGYTFLLGGAITGIFNLLHVNYVAEGGGFYQSGVPLFVYVLGVAAVAFLCYSVAIYVAEYKKLSPFLHTVKVILDKPYSVPAFYDSGNTLYHEQVPVCFAVGRFGGLTDYFAKQALCGNTMQVSVVTVAGSKTVVAVPARVECNGTSFSVLLALPAAKINAPYKIILHSSIVAQ